MQSALVPGSGSSGPDGNDWENGFNDGGAEVRHQHCLWQVEFIHLPQEDYPHLGFFGEPSHLRSRLMVPKKLKDFTMSSGESCSMMRVGGAGLWASRSLQAMAGR